MLYKEIVPNAVLRQHVKCFYIYQSDDHSSFTDTVFPSGCVEIIFNLGSGQWQVLQDGKYVTTPSTELWGQIIRPLSVRSAGRNTMLGIRFYPHAAAYFIHHPMDLFNNQVLDFNDVSGIDGKILYDKLLETTGWDQRIELLEAYLLRALHAAENKLHRAGVVHRIMKGIGQDDSFKSIADVTSQYGITSRYAQKLFVEYTGLTPKLYTKVERFKNSLRLIQRNSESFTSIAYECGYFDQSHFIREFKSFTGTTPSAYLTGLSPVNAVLANY